MAKGIVLNIEELQKAADIAVKLAIEKEVSRQLEPQNVIAGLWEWKIPSITLYGPFRYVDSNGKLRNFVIEGEQQHK